MSASHLNVAVLFRIDMTQEEQRGQGKQLDTCLYPAATVQDRQGQGKGVHQGNSMGWTLVLGYAEGLEGAKSWE